MADMLVRTLGEAIEVTTAAEDELWLCHVDASQMESAILNLAINARDAMPRGGVLTIEAVNLPAGESGAALPPEFEPQDYVMLAVSDTGEGMSSDVLDHCVEPFFYHQGRRSGLGTWAEYGVWFRAAIRRPCNDR